MKKLSINRAPALCIAAATMVALFTINVFAEDDAPLSSNQKIRFYKVNKDMQSDKIRLTNKKISQLGCHNFVKQVRVHRAVQTGFVACSLYENKDCPLATAVPVSHEKDPRRTYLLTEGRGWLPQSEEERGVKVKSWQCDLELEADLLGHDAQLAKVEVVRLRVKAEQAKEIAERVQKKADKAKKASENAIESAVAALERAVAAGYTPPVELSKNIDGDDSDEEEKGNSEDMSEEE